MQNSFFVQLYNHDTRSVIIERAHWFCVSYFLRWLSFSLFYLVTYSTLDCPSSVVVNKMQSKNIAYEMFRVTSLHRRSCITINFSTINQTNQFVFFLLAYIV